MSIKRLSEIVINQIAAGEVIERPASVIKELVENAIDSGADRIEIAIVAGGKSLIRVTDNGRGMDAEDLALAVERHCTSKLGDDLFDIRALGFRGEALPSIGAVSRMTIKSRPTDDGGEQNNGWQISVEGGNVSQVKPAALSKGTIVEVADLFFATPARLKFLKTDRAESNAVSEIVKRTVIAFPHIRFTLSGPDRTTLEFPATSGEDAALKRIAQVLGQPFFDNALTIDAERENVRLTGFIGLPTFNRGNAQHQFVFVNGRPVRDKALWGAIRAAYMDYLARNRHPVLALFLDIDPHFVDVNVHPAKADVRFRDPGLVRGLIVGALREAITNSGHRASTHNATDMMGAFSKPEYGEPPSRFSPSNPAYSTPYQGSGNADYNWQSSPNHPTSHSGNLSGGFGEQSQPDITDMPVQSADLRANFQNQSDDNEALPLGSPRAQIHKNYIVSQTEDGLVIVDQHAAHERLVYEALKEALASKAIASQMLLIPEILDLPEEDVDRLMAYAEPFEQLGLKVERFGPGAIAIRETPSMLGEINAADLVRNLVDDIAEWGTADTLKDRLDYVAATMACHGSVRSGRILQAKEMDALLRQMEATPNSGQCNHGRPTYVELKLKDIERLFGRR